MKIIGNWLFNKVSLIMACVTIVMIVFTFPSLADTKKTDVKITPTAALVDEEKNAKVVAPSQTAEVNKTTDAVDIKSIDLPAEEKNAQVVAPSPALPDEAIMNKLIADIENILPSEPTILTLDECIKLAIENNHELKMKQAILNSVDGDKMIDRSRFYSHVDFIGDFSRDQGTLSKSYFPTYNPQPVSSLGTLDASSLSLSGGGSSSSGFDLSSIAGVDVSEISALASSFGIDISQYLPRKAGTPAEMRAAQRSAHQPTPQEIQDLLDNLSNNTDQIAQLAEVLNQLQQVNNLFGSTNNGTSKKTSSSVAIRYSRRLIEWGKDSSSSVQIRANRRLAIYNYQQKLREIISEVRTTFFTILLKNQQIETREKLLAEYDNKLVQQQKRFEVAQDVPKIDVLTAELDVLNEKNRINALKADLIDKKYELLQIINLPLESNIQFSGDLQPLDSELKEVVSLTKKNSFQISYLKEEYKEDQREFNDRAWDYKPLISGRVGVEGKRTAMGLTLNNANQTYGLDMGVAEYINIPDSSHSTSRKDDNFSMSLGVSWNLFDNTHRKGVSKKFLEKLNETKADLDRQNEIEELNARKAYNALMEAKERLELQLLIVENASKRLEITRKLRQSGRVSEYQLDSYRDTFFSQQDRYFTEQENLIAAQENLRRVMGVFY